MNLPLALILIGVVLAIAGAVTTYGALVGIGALVVLAGVVVYIVEATRTRRGP